MSVANQANEKLTALVALTTKIEGYLNPSKKNKKDETLDSKKESQGKDTPLIQGISDSLVSFFKETEKYRVEESKKADKFFSNLFSFVDNQNTEARLSNSMTRAAVRDSGLGIQAAVQGLGSFSTLELQKEVRDSGLGIQAAVRDSGLGIQAAVQGLGSFSTLELQKEVRDSSLGIQVSIS